MRFDPLVALAPAGGERHDGYYVDRSMGTSYTIKTVADTVYLADGAQPIALGRTGAGMYANAPQSLVLRFDGDRLIASALGDVPDTLIRTERVTRVPATTLRQYTGTYAGTELAVPYQAMVVDSALVLRIPHGDDIVLAPVYADVFESEVLPPIRFIRDAKGSVTALEFDGYGVRGLRLNKQR